MAITRVRKWTPAAINTGTSLVPTGTASLAGSTMVVAIQHQSAAISSVTDNLGGTWVKAADTTDQAATSQRQVALWTRLGTTVGNTAAGVTSVTVTLAASGVARAIVYEYSGVGSVRGAAATAPSTSTTPPGANVTASIGDAAIGVIGYNQVTTGTRLDTLNTSGTGYAELDSFDNTQQPRLSTAESIRTVAGATSPTWTMTSGTTAQATVVLAPASIDATASDTENLTDSVTMARSAVTADALGLTDAGTGVKVLASVVADLLGLSDTSAIESFVIDDTTNDSAGLGDLGAGALNMVRSATDTEGLTDTAAGGRIVDAATDDALGLSDAGAGTLSVATTTAETENLTDSVTVVLNRATADSIGLSDLGTGEQRHESTFYVSDGTAWIACQLRISDGDEWVLCSVYISDGVEWN